MCSPLPREICFVLNVDGCEVVPGGERRGGDAGTNFASRGEDQKLKRRFASDGGSLLAAAAAAAAAVAVNKGDGG